MAAVGWPSGGLRGSRGYLGAEVRSCRAKEPSESCERRAVPFCAIGATGADGVEVL